MIIQKMDKEIEFMCNLSESVLKEGLEQGLEQGLKQGIEQGEIKSAIQLTKSLMKNCNVDINKALEILELPENIRQVVIEELKKQ